MVSNSDYKIKPTALAQFVIILFLICSFVGTTVLAQEPGKMPPALVGIYHVSSYSGSELPTPGAALSLKVQLFNTHDVNVTLQTFATIDGRLIELVPSKVYLNRDDYPEYIIETYAPLVSMSYYFVATTPKGQVVKSDVFSLQRPCIPSTESVSEEITADRTEGQEHLTELVHKAWALEGELKAYESARTLVDNIALELDRLDGKR